MMAAVQTRAIPMTAVLLSLATFASTLGGGLFALRFRDRLHYLLSFTAGVLLGVVSFEVLPEVFELAQQHALDATGAMVALVVGFYHWRVLRADAASRPARHETAPPRVALAAVAPAITASTVDAAPAPVAAPAGMRFILSVLDATEDDVHQVLANLPPAASYLLTPLEPES